MVMDINGMDLNTLPYFIHTRQAGLCIPLCSAKLNKL